jgi:hypothetical protein
MPEMWKALEKAFTSRVKSLKSHQKMDALSQTAKAAERSKHSRKQRKYQVSFQQFYSGNTTIAYLWCSYSNVAVRLRSFIVH